MTNELDEILDWHVHAMLEALLDRETGKRISLTNKLLAKHKSKAKQAIQALIQREVIKGSMKEVKELGRVINTDRLPVDFEARIKELQTELAQLSTLSGLKEKTDE